MITAINNSKECIQALNENLYGILTKTRAPIMAKEVNNTIGKIIAVQILAYKDKEMIGDKTGLRWFDDPNDEKTILVRNKAQGKFLNQAKK